MNPELLVELALLAFKRAAEFGQAVQRMRAGGPEVSTAEIAAAGLEADAAILKARQQVNG
jgi:hypothetical protein